MTLKTDEEREESKSQDFALSAGTGVQCPHCGAEMMYTSPNVMLLTFPPQQHVHCDVCKYKTTLTV